jgi:CubicO group peptidase (beta-lactamase class C family)
VNKTIATTTLLVLIAAVALTQIALRDRDVEPGLITDRLARIDAAITTEVDAGKIPGAVALVAKNGEVVYHKSFGFADIDANGQHFPNCVDDKADNVGGRDDAV